MKFASSITFDNGRSLGLIYCSYVYRQYATCYMYMTVLSI